MRKQCDYVTIYMSICLWECILFLSPLLRPPIRLHIPFPPPILSMYNYLFDVCRFWILPLDEIYVMSVIFCFCLSFSIPTYLFLPLSYPPYWPFPFYQPFSLSLSLPISPSSSLSAFPLLLSFPPYRPFSLSPLCMHIAPRGGFSSPSSSSIFFDLHFSVSSLSLQLLDSTSYVSLVLQYHSTLPPCPSRDTHWLIVALL